MKKRIGTYVPQGIASEPYKAYIPQDLPPDPPIDLNRLYPYLEKATMAIAELNAVSASVPNISLFVYMYVRKEALLSSQIEGTQSSFSDVILFENKQKPNVSKEDVEEVSNYVKALNYGLKRIKEGFPLSLRLIREIHAILISGARGTHKSPGEFRRSQNWIGGSKPSNALFVPPPVNYLNKCLANLEQFLNNESISPLIKAGIAHVQFETIHPFLDGNGRLGRLLITLILCHDQVLNEPILYLSLYLKQNRQLYYNLLQEVREHGTWETWLEFFLEGVYKTAKQTIQTIQRITKLFKQDSEKIDRLGRAKFSCKQIFKYVQKVPQVTVSLLVEHLDMTAPTARNALNLLVEVGILEEKSDKKRNKIYVYRSYLDILESGTEPIQE